MIPDDGGIGLYPTTVLPRYTVSFADRLHSYSHAAVHKAKRRCLRTGIRTCLLQKDIQRQRHLSTVCANTTADDTAARHTGRWRRHRIPFLSQTACALILMQRYIRHQKTVPKNRHSNMSAAERYTRRQCHLSKTCSRNIIVLA